MVVWYTIYTFHKGLPKGLLEWTFEGKGNDFLVLWSKCEVLTYMMFVLVHGVFYDIVHDISKGE